VFGVGHVGYELARILCRLEIRLHLVDSRAEQLDQLRLAEITGGTADVAVHRAVLGETVLERLPDGAHVMIMTHDHAEDFALCDAAIRADRFGTIGLIGSSAKWSRFRHNLAAAGHSEAAISMITSPIGLPELSGKEPAVIAVGVAAKLIMTMVPADVGPSTSSGHEYANARTRPEPVEGHEYANARTRPEPVEGHDVGPTSSGQEDADPVKRRARN